MENGFPANLQRLFARLSVFRGGWTLESAEGISADSAKSAEDSALAPFSILNELEQLCERSLIVVEHGIREISYAGNPQGIREPAGA